MNEPLFTPVLEAHDSRNRPVYICQDKNHFYVYKPATGFTSKKFRTADDAVLLEIFEYQKGCGHNGAFYRKGDVVARGSKQATATSVVVSSPVGEPLPGEPLPPPVAPPEAPPQVAQPEQAPASTDAQDEFANED